MANRCKGFTLIELMVVVAIIAILALMLIPSYQDKLVRDQVVEALPLAEVAKTPIALSWAALQALPPDNAGAGLPTADRIVSNYISATTVQGGAIHLTFGNRAHAQIKGKVLTLRPAVVEDAPVVPVAWICGYAPVPDKMTAKGENRTNVPPIYLPFRCRGG
jgi:type IV pilus assembly protein PilA